MIKSSFGKHIHLVISGGSHEDSVNCQLWGLPASHKIPMSNISRFLQERQGKLDGISTPRIEDDIPLIWEDLAGMYLKNSFIRTESHEPIIAKFENKNHNSKEYNLNYPRPGHCDLPALVKYGQNENLSGGGPFSGRMTIALCFAGAIAIEILKEYGIEIHGHILSIGNETSPPIDPVNPLNTVNFNSSHSYNDSLFVPRTQETESTREAIATKGTSKIPGSKTNKNSKETEYHAKYKTATTPDMPNKSPINDAMISSIQSVKSQGDSLGGTIQVYATGLPIGLGEPIFNSLESQISSAVFSIPAVKGIEFGNGFASSAIKGSENNDGILSISEIDNGGKINMATNNSGGILGGLSTGMPLVLKVAIKPTPTISKEQQTIDLETLEQTLHKFRGRHDACIVPRALPCVKSALALCILDALIELDLHSKKNEVLPPDCVAHVVGFNTNGNLRSIKRNYMAMDIDSLRSQVLSIDAKLQELLEERLAITNLIGKEKLLSSKPILDEQREMTVLSKLDIKWHNTFREIMTVSKEAQRNQPDSNLFGLLGRKLSHSYSKKIHESFGIYNYHLMEVEPENLEKFLDTVDFMGLNVTFPYKQSIMEFLKPNATAKKIGSVNTIYYDSKGYLTGTNTDFDGFKYLVKLHKVVVKGKSVLILGNGGASKAVQQAVLTFKPKEIIVATTKKKLTSADTFDNILYLPYDYIEDDFDIIINTTPLGNYPNFSEKPLDLRKFKKCKTVIDIIYNPFITEFLIEGKRLGKRVINGLTMLCAQADVASDIFVASINGVAGLKGTQRPDFLLEESIKSSVRSILEDTLDIVLVGLSGSGKTAIGKELARRYELAFVDIDDEIEKISEKPISSYFENDDKNSIDEFRKLEAEMVKSIFSRSPNIHSFTPRVIATGGGVISSEENIKAISRNSIVIYIDRDINLIKAKDKPIYKTASKKKLYELRDPIYTEISQIKVEHKNSIKSTVNQILRKVEEYYEKNYFN